MNWLATSIILSVVLTVVLNLALRAFPGAGDRMGQKLSELSDERPNGGVFVPWKAMILVSLLLTLGLNLFLLATR